MTKSWWQNRNPSFLENVLNKVNISMEKKYPVEKSTELFGALNLIWNEFFAFRDSTNNLTNWELEKGRKDNSAFTELLLQGLAEPKKDYLLGSSTLKSLVNLKPQIMSHEVLRRNNYDPFDISEDLQKEAQNIHLKLLKAFTNYEQENRNHGTTKWLLINLAKLLYVVRSNIAHGEKTPKGPDLQKVKRDEKVCQATNPLLELIINLVFDNPSTRLAVYGTLAPNEPNESVLNEIKGDWINGKVTGHIYKAADLPNFEWDTSADEITVKIFCSDELPKNLEKIDRFEGSNYKRILIPVRLADDSFTVANIYESAIK